MFRRECDIKTEVTRRNADRPLKNLLVTGGCGFIGANFINSFAVSHPTVHIYNLDKLDYCANTESVIVQGRDNYTFLRGDIGNTDLVMHIMATHDIDTVLNFAAQSHVDNSFGNSMTFTKNNVLGTHNLLECARVWGKIEKFIHVSTDEVYGEVEESQAEHAMLNPTNPYAATKAAAEFIVKSYTMSFGLPCIITRGNNVYGRYQYPEKVIPRFIMLLNQNQKMTIQGSGNNTRTFIHASDVAAGFTTVVDKGIIGEIYNIGCQDEMSILEVAKRLVTIMKPNDKLEDWLVSVPDRDFNDLRYDITSAKLEKLGWERKVQFDEGFADTVKWYTEEALPSGFWADIKQHISTSAIAHPNAAAQ
jgi:dTDP-glucose 4,6-dehydratase